LALALASTMLFSNTDSAVHTPSFDSDMNTTTTWASFAPQMHHRLEPSLLSSRPNCNL